MKEDVIVSIRMPRRLQEDLHKLVENRAFLDLSEAVRSIVRRRYIESTQLGMGRLESIKTELESEKVRRHKEVLTRQIARLSDELKKIGEDL